MAKHLGRNPFSKSKSVAQPPLSECSEKKQKPTSSAHIKKNPRSIIKEPAKWLLVDLPADSLTFALKTAMWVKSVVKK